MSVVRRIYPPAAGGEPPVHVLLAGSGPGLRDRRHGRWTGERPTGAQELRRSVGPEHWPPERAAVSLVPAPRFFRYDHGAPALFTIRN